MIWRETAALRSSSCTNTYTSESRALHFPRQITPELHWRLTTKPRHNYKTFGAGERNRTVVISLEGFCSTIELHPQIRNFHLASIDSHATTKSWWRGRDSNLRTRERADLQSAAINHSATSPLNPRLCRIFGETSIKLQILSLGLCDAHR